MEKIVFVMVIAMSLFANKQAHAQIEQDNWLIGASSSLSFQNTYLDGSNNQRSINFGSKFGYFVMDSFALGGQVSFSSLKLNEDVSTEISVGPFVRYYFPDSFFAGLGYSFTRLSRDIDTINRSDMGGSLALEVGYPIWVLIERLTIEPTVAYSIGTGALLKGTNRLSMNIGFVLYL